MVSWVALGVKMVVAARLRGHDPKGCMHIVRHVLLHFALNDALGKKEKSRPVQVTKGAVDVG